MNKSNILYRKRGVKMNERFLCRGKRQDNGWWVKGYLVAPKINNSELKFAQIITDGYQIEVIRDFIPTEDYSVIPETVGQCIGLRDTSDSKQLIFEYDIVRYKHKDETDWKIAKVEWQDWASYPAFDLTHANFDDNFDCNAFSHIFESGDYEIEVIGNTIDNPELYK